LAAGTDGKRKRCSDCDAIGRGIHGAV
jgi:hypothetical protein